MCRALKAARKACVYTHGARVPTFGREPESHKTLAEESMLGKLTTLASNCPASNVLDFQLFGLFLALHWARLLESPDGPVETG